MPRGTVRDPERGGGASVSRAASRAPARRDAASRERLLASAEAVFAEHGFHSATTREICRRAGVNIAAISYHFGDKQGLYLAVIEEIGRSIEARHPLKFERTRDAEADLARFIGAFIDRILDDSVLAWRWKIIAREFVEPTTAMDEVVRRMIRPNFEFLRELVGAVLGRDAGKDDPLVTMCAASVIGQALMYKNCAGVCERLFGACSSRGGVEALAAHVSRFSIAALRGLREGAGTGASASGEGVRSKERAP